MCHRGSYMTRDGTFTVLGDRAVSGGGGWWGQCGAQRAELRDERAPVAPIPQQRGPELKAASYFATRPYWSARSGGAHAPMPLRGWSARNLRALRRSSAVLSGDGRCGRLLGERVAATYDESSADMFEPGVVDAVAGFLAGLAGRGRALELSIGTGRIALPL